MNSLKVIEEILNPYPIPYPPVPVPLLPPLSSPIESNQLVTPLTIPIQLKEVSPPTTPQTPTSHSSSNRSKRFLTPLKPFKPPQFITPASASPSLPSTSAHLTRVQPPKLTLPNLFSPCPIPTSKRKELSSSPVVLPIIKKQKRPPFHSPSLLNNSNSSNTNNPSSPSSSSSSKISSKVPAIELTILERRLILLKQARKYQLIEERGGKESETVLKSLSLKWKEVGKAAIELLWEHASSSFSDPTSSSFNPFLTSTTSNPFSSSWGFSSSPLSSSSSTSSSFNTSWGWSNDNNSIPLPTVNSNMNEFLSKIEEEMKQSGKTREMILEELGGGEEGDDGKELPSLEEVFGNKLMMKKKTSKKGGKEMEVKVEEEEEEEEEDELMIELEKYCAEFKGEKEESISEEVVEAEAEEEGEDEEEKEEEEEEEEMSMRKFIKSIGIDPKLFGWDEEEEEYVS